MTEPLPSKPSSLEEKLSARTARVGVLGLGYVGLPLCVELARAGFPVTGIDVVEAKVAGLNAGRSHVEDIASEDVAALVREGRFRATTDFDAIAALDAVIVCVPTPLRKTRDPDLSYVVGAVNEVASRAHADMLVVLESTTYPGTTDEVLVPALEARGLVVGRDAFVAFSPERIDPGNRRFTLRNTPKVIGGVTPRCTALACALYGAAVERVVPVSTPRAAELAKLLENTFRAVNIGLANELALMCDKLGVDVWEVIDAAATKPFGFMKFTPGPGLGGHCIPVDPLYLSWKLKERNYTARFIELADDVNSHMPDFVVRKAMLALNDAGKCVRGARVLIVGVAYKRDVQDVRESPAIDVIHQLERLGALVAYHDPHVPSLAPAGIEKTSAPTLDAAAHDLCVIVADHSCFDMPRLALEAALVLDCRNACRDVRDEALRRKIVKL